MINNNRIVTIKVNFKMAATPSWILWELNFDGKMAGVVWFLVPCKISFTHMP